MSVDRNGLEILGREECLRLLGGQSVGRLAVTSRALPLIIPVNFLLDRERILIRTTAGTKLEAATAGAVVAFEVDEIEPMSHTGWSVSLTGMATVVEDPADRARVATLPLARWAPSGFDHVIAISTDIISGRRIPYRHAARRTA